MDEPLLVRLILEDCNKEHMRNLYSSITGKELYPVAVNRLDEDYFDEEIGPYYVFGGKSWYKMIR